METMGTIPGAEEVHTDLKEWCHELDVWKIQQVAAYEANPEWTPVRA